MKRVGNVRAERTRVARPPALGLVGQVTSVTRLPSLSVAETWRNMNRQRRMRRMRRCVIASADATRVQLESGGSRIDAVFVTLTYADGAQWSSRDVSTYIRRVREWCGRRGVKARYQWVIELTQRGRPHYHVLFWVPRGFRIPKPDASGQWTRGLSRVELARRPVGYLIKYASKGSDGEFPKGARLFGVGNPDAEPSMAAHRAGLPAWLNNIAGPGRCVRVARVGWVEKETGVIHDTPFAVTVTRDAWGCVEVVITEKVKACSF